jgi:hypothetical protein
MKKQLSASLVSAAACVYLIAAPAQTETQPKAKAKKYELKLMLIADTQPFQQIRVIQEQGTSWPYVGYKSLDSPTLKNWLQSIPDGSTIEWFPSCVRTGGEPTGKELEEFRSDCDKENVKLIVHPSG